VKKPVQSANSHDVVADATVPSSAKLVEALRSVEPGSELDLVIQQTIPARIVDVQSMLLGQIEENTLRKDFTITERVAIVDSLRTYGHGGDRRSDQARNSKLETLSLAAACKLVGLSEDTYRRAKVVEESGVPELVQAMDLGKLSIHAAQALAQASAAEQQECLTKPLDDGRSTARAVKKQLRLIRNVKRRADDVARAVQSPKSDDDIQIHHCPFQNLEQVAGIKPDSVPLICTDIPYTNDFIEQIEDLAAFAERVLVPGGTFVAYLGQHRFNEKLPLLDKHLRFQWLATSAWEGPGNDVARLRLISKSLPIVVYSKGRWKPVGKWIDMLLTNDREKDWHPWQRPLAEIEKFVCFHSRPGDLVVDPCGGGFTTAIACIKNHRRFIGCDIDENAVANGQERLEQERRGEVVQDDCRDVTPLDWRPMVRRVDRPLITRCAEQPSASNRP
jgi:hypothetical protein